MKIRRITVTPVAFPDYPLLNAAGVHGSHALRSVIEVEADDGIVGLGETSGDIGQVRRLQQAASALVGADVYALQHQRELVASELGAAPAAEEARGPAGLSALTSAVDRVYSPFEVACLDIQARAAGRPLSDLLGGAVRDSVPFSAYLFYKWGGHPGEGDDEWGAALDGTGLVDQARTLIERYGFTAIKLKGGVFDPEFEIDSLRALRDAFPDHPLRLDPNGAWTVRTAIRMAPGYEGLLEYLEDPVMGLPGMVAVRRSTSVPLATNMCVVRFDQMPEAVARGAVDVVLADHHFWGGLRRSQLLAGMCETWGLQTSMHSSSHLGISLAAMTHLAAATPNLTYACDTHWPWKRPEDEVVVAGSLDFVDGSVRVPTGPGLGVELDRDAVTRMNEVYRTCGVRFRDDTACMRTVDSTFSAAVPRW